MWDKIGGLFSSGLDNVISSLGDAIDKNVTSDEEREKLKLAMQKSTVEFRVSQFEAMAKFDKEITTRQKNDMQSDSWLSKNIRPLLLAFLTVATVVLAYLTIFILAPEKSALLTPWLDLLKTLNVTAFTFYFGSRGFEKVQSIRSGK